MYGMITKDGYAAFAGLLRVDQPDRIGILVKDQETLTGRPGRLFFTNAVELDQTFQRWRVATEGPNAFVVDQLSRDGTPAESVIVTAVELEENVIGLTARKGRLFTEALM